MRTLRAPLRDRTDAIDRILDLEDEINAQIERLVILKHEITDVIAAVKNVDHRLILEKQYLSELS